MDTYRAAELTTVILAATLPTAPRFWRYLRTGNRNARQHVNNEGHSALSSRTSRKLVRNPLVTVSSDAATPKRWYKKLRYKAKDPLDEEMQMQIMKTQRIEVTTERSRMP